MLRSLRRRSRSLWSLSVGSVVVMSILFSVDAAEPAKAANGPPPVVTPTVSSIDVTAAVPFVVSWNVTTGASALTYNSVHLYVPDGNELPISDCSSSSLVSGSTANGNYDATCTIPSGLQNGTYATQIQVDDSLGNVVFPAGPSLSVTGSTVVPAPVVTPTTVTPPTVPLPTVARPSVTVTPQLQLTHSVNGQAVSTMAAVSCTAACTINATLYELISVRATISSHLISTIDAAVNKPRYRRVVIARTSASLKSGRRETIALRLNRRGSAQLDNASTKRPITNDQLVIIVDHSRSITKRVRIT